MTLLTLSFPASNTTSVPSRNLHMWPLLTAPQPTPQCTETDFHLSSCTMALWVICGTTSVLALKLFDFESCTPTFKNIKLLTSSRGSMKVPAPVSPYSAYLLPTSPMNSKLNSSTLLLILHLAYNTMGQRKFGLVGYCTMMTSHSCPPARASCKPCYMSARNGAFEIVCRSTHRTQKSWLPSRPPPFKRPVVASTVTNPAQPYPPSTSLHPS